MIAVVVIVNVRYLKYITSFFLSVIAVVVIVMFVI